MISFSREDKILKVELKSGLAPKANVYTLAWNCNDDCYAELLRKHFENKLGDALQSIRKEAYLEGFKDGKGKRKKQEWFSRWFKGE